ncbi:hypothetical protein JTE88_02570 [Arcanobacterium phocisimile]|uniref:Uncharacterized protein n=1 Tax=Arcanobacterium phocisimile TaxID=1302235 RepID=A0ABX7IHN3_9ACTO|nr:MULTISPECIES: hypothetical protein [Arcanobacterium]QRV02643.1 hypothetical protein JTE88_02570 [Arcanobacterium phocisimile]
MLFPHLSTRYPTLNYLPANASRYRDSPANKNIDEHINPNPSIFLASPILPMGNSLTLQWAKNVATLVHVLHQSLTNAVGGGLTKTYDRYEACTEQ